MEKEVRQGILEMLTKAIITFEHDYPSSAKLRSLSDRNIQATSMVQDEDSLSIAILLYCLSKVVDRLGKNLKRDHIRNHLQCAKDHIEKGEEREYRACIKGAFDHIQKMDHEYKRYVQEIIKLASIRKGSAIYAFGISAARTAELLGISLWELHDYVSATRIPDEDSDIRSVRQRLAYTRKLFT